MAGGSKARRNPNNIPVLYESGKTLAELEAEAKREHPEWFDADGKRLPTAVTGARSPGGKYLAKPGNTDAERGVKRMPVDLGVEVSPRFTPSYDTPVPVVRCTAKTKTTGKRCGRWSLRGSTLCYAHGGNAKYHRERAESLVEAARMRIISMADSAIDVLKEILEDSSVPAAVRLKAAQDVLTRSGIGSVQEVAVEVTHTNPAAEVSKRLETLALTATVLSGGSDTDKDEDDTDFDGSTDTYGE